MAISPPGSPGGRPGFTALPPFAPHPRSRSALSSPQDEVMRAQQDAEKRVADVYARTQAKLKEAETAAKDAADKARKASAYASLWLFISLLIGAFAASLAATLGGRQRDI